MLIAENVSLVAYWLSGKTGGVGSSGVVFFALFMSMLIFGGATVERDYASTMQYFVPITQLWPNAYQQLMHMPHDSSDKRWHDPVVSTHQYDSFVGAVGTKKKWYDPKKIYASDFVYVDKKMVRDVLRKQKINHKIVKDWSHGIFQVKDSFKSVTSQYAKISDSEKYSIHDEVLSWHEDFVQESADAINRIVTGDASVRTTNPSHRRLRMRSQQRSKTYKMGALLNVSAEARGVQNHEYDWNMANRMHEELPVDRKFCSSVGLEKNLTQTEMVKLDDGNNAVFKDESDALGTPLRSVRRIRDADHNEIILGKRGPTGMDERTFVYLNYYFDGTKKGKCFLRSDTSYAALKKYHWNDEVAIKKRIEIYEWLGNQVQAFAKDQFKENLLSKLDLEPGEKAEFVHDEQKGVYGVLKPGARLDHWKFKGKALGDTFEKYVEAPLPTMREAFDIVRDESARQILNIVPGRGEAALVWNIPALVVVQGVFYALLASLPKPI